MEKENILSYYLIVLFAASSSIQAQKINIEYFSIFCLIVGNSSIFI